MPHKGDKAFQSGILESRYYLPNINMTSSPLTGKSLWRALIEIGRRRMETVNGALPRAFLSAQPRFARSPECDPSVS